MTPETGTERETLAAQREMFRLAEQRYGLTLKALSIETGENIGKLKTYNNSNIFARAKMPLAVFVALARVIPDDCLAVVMEGTGKVIATSEPDEGAPDELLLAAAEFSNEYLRATAGAATLNHVDRARIADIAARLASKARAVAAGMVDA